MITIVTGAQYGGEGKGKVCAYLAREQHYTYACRCGGVNSSHTVVTDDGRCIALRTLPTSVTEDSTNSIVYGAGSLLHIPTLMQEIQQLRVASSRICIDPQAGVITPDIVARQRSDGRYAQIGSTLTGTGYATAMRAKRSLALAHEYPELQTYIRTTDWVPGLLHRATVDETKHVLVEGHQAFGLSNYHGDYPYTSSRDCTASALLSEIGLGPCCASHMRIVLVVKAFPTRNHAGALPNEMPKSEADERGILEEGGGSWGIANQRRRSAHIDFSIIERAVIANSATEIALTGADYIDPTIKGATTAAELTAPVREFVATLSDRTRLPVTYVSTGPETGSMVVMHDWKNIRSGKVSERV